MPTVNEDVLNRAIEVFDLEVSMRRNADALRTALRAALTAWEPEVALRYARAARAFSDELESQIEASDDKTGALTALDVFSAKMEAEISHFSEPYAPSDGDIVEVHLTGPVSLYENKCTHCNEYNDLQWSVTDRHTGQEFFFEPKHTPKVSVRVISREAVAS